MALVQSRAPPLPTSSQNPVTPPTMSRAIVPGTLPTPPSSIQKYRDALRRDLTARYEAAAIAGLNAKVPEDASEDPDYGYDENPFDTRARLLLSFTGDSQGSATTPLSPESPPCRKRVLDYGDDEEQTPPAEFTAVLDSPEPSVRSTRRRWSYGVATESAPASGLASAAMSRSSSLSFCDTPGSEMSFEVGRTQDYVGLYGRPSLRVHASGISPARTPPPPPVVSSASSHAVFNPSPLASSLTPPKERRNSIMGRLTPIKAIKPLTQLTPSPQPRRSRRDRRRSRPPAELDAWNEVVLTRSESETMLLAAAGFASQRCRAGR